MATKDLEFRGTSDEPGTFWVVDFYDGATLFKDMLFFHEAEMLDFSLPWVNEEGLGTHVVIKKYRSVQIESKVIERVGNGN